MLLTPEERGKFARYLEDDIKSNRMLIEQMKKIKNAGAPIVIEVKTKMVAAEIVVANMLRNSEDM